MRFLSTVFFALVFLLFIPTVGRAGDRSVAPDQWTPQARALYDLMKQSGKHEIPSDMTAKPFPMSNGKSFFLIYVPEDVTPDYWIVSMPGTHGVVMDEFALWSKSVRGRKIGLIEVQWWLGSGDRTEDYLTPQDIYKEIHILLSRLGVKQDHALLHGFSRGAANIYAVAALDRVRGGHFFNAVVANSGGVAFGYPPTRQIVDGMFGDKPFLGQSWVTVCGANDPNPDRDGCPAMQKTATWLETMGGRVSMRIEDPAAGHGALHTNVDNANALLEWYLSGR